MLIGNEMSIGGASQRGWNFGLVNHARQPIRRFAAALSADDSLRGTDVHCDARGIIGRSAMVEIRHRTDGRGEPRPYIDGAWVLPEGIEPVELPDACVWTPTSKKPLPRYAPQWVRTYANGAVAQHWLERKGATP